MDNSWLAMSFYSFLDNLLQSQVRNAPPTPPPRTEVVAGGYPEDIFVFLTEREKEEFNCSVCYNVLKDAHQCKNGHKFCYTCVYVWSTSNGSGAEACPMCRCDGLYARNETVNTQVGRKRVRCSSVGCNWHGQLSKYDEHKHRIYDQKELNLASQFPLISESKLTASKPSEPVPITSMRQTNQSTTELLRSMNSIPSNPPTPRVLTSNAPYTSSSSTLLTPSLSTQASTPRTSQAAVSTPSNPRRTPPPRTQDQAEPSINQTVPENRSTASGNAAVVPNRRDSTSNTPARRIINPASRRPSDATAPPTRPGIVPRPPANPRTRTNNTSVNPANRPLQALRRPSGDATPAPLTAPSATPPISSEASSRPITPLANRPLPPDPPARPPSPAQMNYRRLAPIRRRIRAVDHQLESREQLVVMLTLMNLELDQRRLSIERQMQANLDNQQRVSLDEISQVRTLNRRLSVVANNLERILGPGSSPGDAATGPSTSSDTSSSRVSDAPPPPPPPRARATIRFSGISGLGGMDDSSSDEN